MSLLFPDEIRLRDGGYHGGTRWFILEHYFRCITSKGAVTIPTGFRTDGASIPKAFHNIMGPFGEYFPAAIFHDWAYSKASNGYFPADRKMADDVFKELMFNVGVPWLTREIIYQAVRGFGWRSYKKK
jgi:hypothetical protein